MDDPREGARLAAKVDARAWAAKHLFGPLAGKSRILEVGCGPGHFVEALAEHFPKSEILGVDASASRIMEAQKRCSSFANVTLQVGNARDLDLPDGSVDAVFTRFLLEYLMDAAVAVEELRRVCAPGGVVILQDLDGQLLWNWPEEDELSSALDLVMTGLKKTGFDPFVGRKLFSFAQAAQLENITVAIEPYHIVAGEPDIQTLTLWQQKFSIAKPAIARIAGEQKADELAHLFESYLRRNDTLTYSNLFTVIGWVPNPGRPAERHPAKS